jgi:hypothetical protein
MPVVLFGFYGRTPNMRLQAPFIHRILAEHPDVRWDVWNLARNQLDAIYLQSLSGPRINVHNKFWRTRSYEAIYRQYAEPEYADCVFVKCDDDIVFLQTDRFNDFLDAVTMNPGAVISALTINNGSSTRHEPGLWRQYKATGIPLLDVHTDVRFADMCHNYFFQNHQRILEQPLKLVNTTDWMSINLIGLDHATMRGMAAMLNTPHPPEIAGRGFGPHDKLGDEGAVNLLPRKILKGFTACHLGFGPQQPTPEQFDGWREQYARLGADYLAVERVAAV